MRWEEEAVVRQHKDLGVDGLVERPRVALLEVGAPAAADEEGVACKAHFGLAKYEGHAAGVRAAAEHERHAAVRVAGSRTRLDLEGTESYCVSVLHEHVGLSARRLRDTRLNTRQ